MLHVLLKFSQNRPKKILFSSKSKKGQKKTNCKNHFISRKLFKKGQIATLLHREWKNGTKCSIDNFGIITMVYSNFIQLARTLWTILAGLFSFSINTLQVHLIFNILINAYKNWEEKKTKLLFKILGAGGPWYSILIFEIWKS